MTPFEFEMPDQSEPNGNAFVIMKLWSRAAKEADWSKENINDVIKEARGTKDYHKLRTVLSSYAENGLNKEE